MSRPQVSQRTLAAVVLTACVGVGALGCGATGAAGAAAAKTDTTGAVKTGNHAQDFTARDMDGNTVRLSDYLGKQAILLNFWSTYCEPCLAEFPHMRRLYAEKKPKGFIVLAVSMDGPETVANVKPFAQRNNLNFPVLLDEDSTISALYNPKKSAPLTILIDRSGNVIQVREGYNPGDEETLAVEVSKMLDGPAPPK